MLITNVETVYFYVMDTCKVNSFYFGIIGFYGQNSCAETEYECVYSI